MKAPQKTKNSILYPKECNSVYIDECIENSIHSWIEKMWYLYTMEFYSAIKENEILLLADK
jgi:hypothetical protein